ncbi:MAG: efflux RND transporter periplasmic adaptor subunit [Candidatus Thiodiazotropha taylori]|nr:efflux RND transporter periplasmic adaptor subunit [Candidatus Thiodiazotropha taylori]MCG8108271.1 efflux RND transporter periplasmic adaptor subunit [Candidatus Thiodiazotropha taylori]MCG8110338.1 efflux RND transporter periplasmic adaptor subunit [Candidatus Thiodiazotropha taylori]MCW4280610.1 efflux RND transporter periplasmic adaptor subunit [Candidatus Thiodiazotropha taylori]MCW4282687.1 efflux RND transporter periplasmic adaptor subunit [Candidatus Thiodiazotropha taylori]
MTAKRFLYALFRILVPMTAALSFVTGSMAFGETHHSSNQAKDTEIEGLSDASNESVPTTTLYSCPMHPNETSDKPGRCNICGMHLVAQTDTDHSGHDHHQPMSHMDHSGHDQHQPTDHMDHSGHDDHQAMNHADHSGHDDHQAMNHADHSGHDDHQAMNHMDHSGHDDHQAMSNMDHSGHDHHQAMDHADHKHEDHQTIYACPMHPNETSDKPGRCSICGMHLVAQTDTDHSGHDHHQPMSQMDHAGHDQHQPMSHTDHSGHNHEMMSHSDHETEEHPKAENAHSHDMKSMQPGSEMPKGMTKPKRYWDSDQLPSISSRSKASKENNENTLLSKAKRVPVNDSPEQEVAVSQDTHTDHDHQHSGTTYICPMHPQIISHEADASCPICGMNLVPVAAAKQSMESENPQVFLESAVIQNMGIRTITAERRNLGKTIKTQGRVTADDERIYNIHSRTGGWIENLYLVTEGDHIERKDELVDFYSPWINRAQLDLIEALEEFDLVAFEPERKAELDAKIDSYRNTLRSLKVPPMDLMRIEQYRKVLNTVQITSPASGWITELNVSEGSYVEPYQTMFTVVDLSEVWIMVDIFEHQAPWVKKGNKVSVTSPAIPGREWIGEIDFIYPEINPVTRTLRARIEVTNPDEALLLNMFVQVEISDGATKKNAVTVPREAIILTGEREIIVKYQGKGHFQPVDVKTGLWGDNQVEIIDGLNEGAEVVVSGQFLIDSESNIQSSLLRMAE